MSRAIKIWLSLFLLVSLKVWSAGPTLERDDLVVSVRAPKTVVPGQYETFILEVSNDYTFPLHFKVNLKKPTSWKTLSGIDELVLEPGEKRMVLFVIELERACETGNQSITFEFFDAQHDVRIVETITTQVQDIHKVKVNSVRKPYYLTGGEDFSVVFEIHNMGNCHEKVVVTADPGTLAETTLNLPPNATRYITVNHKVDPALARVGYVSCGLSVQVAYQQRPIHERVSIKAFPKSTRKSDPYQRLPIQASINYFGAQNTREYEQGFQLELKGAGAIDKNGRHIIDFVARGPNRFTIARFGNYDQYSLQYNWQHSRTSKTTFRVGDFAYNLTPVTEMFRWGRGFGVDHVSRKFEVGGFYNQPRFFSDVKYQYAAYGKYKWTPFFATQVSAMQKYYREGASPATLLSFRGELDLAQHHLMAEIATGSRGGAQGLGGTINASGTIAKLRYQSQTILAGKDFPGYYTNSVFSNTTVNYNLNKWGFNAGVFYNASNPAQDTIFTTAPYSINNTVGTSYSPTGNIQLQLSYIYRFREDRLPGKKFSFRENATRYRFTYRSRLTTVQVDGELATTENLLVNPENNRGTTYNIRLRADRNLNSQLKLGGFGQYLYTNRYDSESQAYLLYGANFTYIPVRNIRFSAGYRNNYLLDEYTSDRLLLNFDLDMDFGNHGFTVNTSHALMRNTVGQKDFFINVRYTYSIDAPIRKQSDLYTLTGQLRSDNPRDVAGVILTINGQAVISDEYGRFVINDLPEGLHYLHIDPGTLGIGLVTTVETPLEVMIAPSDENKVTIPVVKGGSISGTVHQTLDKRDVMDGQKPTIKVVKISQGQREYLTYTDDAGNYSFKNLLPGNWKVRVVNGESADGKYKMDQNNVVVDVKPGREATVDFEIIARQRKVKFSNQSVDLKINK